MRVSYAGDKEVPAVRWKMKTSLKRKLVQQVQWRLPTHIFNDIKARAAYNYCSVNSMGVQLILRGLEKELEGKELEGTKK